MSWHEPARDLPVRREVDVLVAGGGPAGVAAAIAAARAGAGTLLVEAAGMFGGMWTLGMQLHATCFHDRQQVIVGGIPREIIRRLEAEGAAENPEEKVRAAPGCFWVGFDPEMMKCILDDMITEAGVEPLLHTTCVGAVVEDQSVRGVIVENKSGRAVLRAKVVIDCTGDADIAYFTGAPTLKGREDGRSQPVTMTFLLENVEWNRVVQFRQSDPGALAALEQDARERGELTLPKSIYLGAPTLWPGVTYHNVTRVLDVDCTRAEDLTRAEIEGRRQVREVIAFYRRCIPGFERCRLLAIAPSIGLRESRRIVGEYTLTARDVIEARHFPDAVARHHYYIDVHNPEGAGLEGGDTGQRCPPAGSHYEIPYSCLVPHECEGLLVAGRCISATRDALGSLRTTVCCAQLGEAAGVAAAAAVRQGILVRNVKASLPVALPLLGADAVPR
jgi:hypothetical protein